MKKMLLVVGMVSFLMIAGDAFAFPTVDGSITGLEWDLSATGMIINANDLNEVFTPYDISDDYDLSRVAMIIDKDGSGGNDGMYILYDLYGAPNLGKLPEITAKYPAFTTVFDMNKDGLLNNNDRMVVLQKVSGTNTLSVYNASTSLLGTLSSFSVGTGTSGVIELFIPDTMFVNFSSLSDFQTFTELDNGGGPNEDYVPDSGWSTTIPEPTSMLLFGIGLLGCGRVVRRKFTA